MKVINTINQVDSSEWRRVLATSPTATFFQSEQCYRFYESLSFLRPFLYAVSEKDILKALVVGYIQQEKNGIKQFLTRRAIIPGGLLLADDVSDQVLTTLLTVCKTELRKKAIYIEIRNFNDYSTYREVFEKCGFRYLPHLNFHIDTSSEETVLSNMGKSRKRDINTSLRNGAGFVDAPTRKDIEAYYQILKHLYATRVKTPLFPFEFFDKLFTSGIGVYRLIYYKDEIIGGTLCVGLENRSLYEWFACGKDGVYKNIHPSTMATFAGIQYGARNGFPVFDMMGAGKPNEDYGVRDFKSKFGGKLVENGRFVFVQKPLLFQFGKTGVKLIKRISWFV